MIRWHITLPYPQRTPLVFEETCFPAHCSAGFVKAGGSKWCISATELFLKISLKWEPFNAPLCSQKSYGPPAPGPCDKAGSPGCLCPCWGFSWPWASLLHVPIGALSHLSSVLCSRPSIDHVNLEGLLEAVSHQNQRLASLEARSRLTDSNKNNIRTPKSDS